MEKIITNFAIGYDKETKKQFEHCCEQPYVHKASLMPDAHSGYVAPVGSVFCTKDYVVPSWVGYDIGCGMIAVKFDDNIINEVKENLDIIYEKVREKVPMGKGKVNHIQNVSEITKQNFKELFNKFKQGPYRQEVYRFIKNNSISHLGSLGSGNHFIELSEYENETWLVIHSGSRGIGKKAATFYMKESAKDKDNFESTNPILLESTEGQEYMNILEFGLEFALLNRMEMAYSIRDVIREVLNKPQINFELWVNKNHNHAIYEHGFLVHRKGATPANKGERGVIPANMRDGCILVEGLGNEEFLFSSSHGAGRLLSRGQAKNKISLKEFKDSMKGIKGTVNENTIDEAPMAYKNIYDVMQAQVESVKEIKQLKPIINWKGES